MGSVGVLGMDEETGSLFSYADVEAWVPAGHLLRASRALVNETPAPTIAPERLLRAMPLQAF